MHPYQIATLTPHGKNLYFLITHLHENEFFEQKMEKIFSYIQAHAGAFKKEDRLIFDELRMRLFLIKSLEENYSHNPNAKVLQQWDLFTSQLAAIDLHELPGSFDMTDKRLAETVAHSHGLSLDELYLLLPYCKEHLQQLSIPQNIDDSEEVDDDVLSELLSFGMSLKQLNLRYASSVTNIGLYAVGSYQNGLETLVFPNCHQMDEGITFIMEHCPNLRHVDLSFYSLIGEGALASIAGNCGNLEILNLSQCDGLNDRGLAILASGCPKLIELNLTSCRNITHSGIQKLAEGPLQRLSLWCCNVCDMAIEVLGAKPSKLHTLNIWGNERLSEKSIAALCGAQMSHLQMLYLQISAQISSQMVAQLQTAKPQLQIRLS